jgi:hypothetical protein
MLLDKDQKIARPRQIYTGYDERKFVAMGDRIAATPPPEPKSSARETD